jgi:hypothetical protein
MTRSGAYLDDQSVIDHQGFQHIGNDEENGQSTDSLVLE